MMLSMLRANPLFDAFSAKSQSENCMWYFKNKPNANGDNMNRQRIAQLCEKLINNSICNAFE